MPTLEPIIPDGMFTSLDASREGTVEFELRALQAKYRVSQLQVKEQVEALLRVRKENTELAAALAKANLTAVNLSVEVSEIREAKREFNAENPDVAVHLSKWHFELLRLRQEVKDLRARAEAAENRSTSLLRANEVLRLGTAHLQLELSTNSALLRKNEEVERLTAELEKLRAYKEAMDATKPLKGGTSPAGFTHLEID